MEGRGSRLLAFFLFFVRLELSRKEVDGDGRWEMGNCVVFFFFFSFALVFF
jgi:hypothetical protein